MPSVPLDLTSGSARWIAAIVSIAVYGWGSAVITDIVFPRLRRPVYLAVTRDEVLGYRMPRLRLRSMKTKLLFRAPLSAVRIEGHKAKKEQRWAIRVVYRGPAAKGRLPRLTVGRFWLRELYEVVTALQVSGAEVHPALEGIAEAL